MDFTYYVVMRDFGRRGREAVVDPELTRTNIVDLICSKEYADIIFVHEVSTDSGLRDVTEEILDEADAARNDANHQNI